jgi:hypothetical protein
MKNDISENWEIPEGLDTTNFDFSWRPSIHEPLYIQQFGTQHQKTSGPRFISHGATQVKYRNEMIAKKIPSMANWSIVEDTDIANIEFDYSWHHDETEPPMNYVFGDQYGPAEESKRLIYKRGNELPLKFLDYPVAKVVYRPLDVIFLSNNETNAQQRYDRLCSVAGRDVKWISGIDNREQALKAAAEASSTKWFLLFPAKLYADENFDFNFQPIRHYDPKHYIFYAKNPVNDLVYGHQAAVCYNRQLVLDTVDYGLDFTMCAPHDIVPVISGIAEFNSDIMMTWRTAFREAIKLREENSKESMERLNVWRTIGKGKNSEWSLIGAQDGVEFFEKVNGDQQELMKSFMWEWTTDYFNNKYK